MEKALTVVVMFEAKSGKEIELKNILQNVIEPSRIEKGCLEYRLHQNLNDSAQFFLYENWVNQAALQEHFNQPYIVELLKKLDGLLAKPFQSHMAEEWPPSATS